MKNRTRAFGGRHSWSRRTEAGLSWKRNAGAGQLQERENRLQEQSLREEALREEQEALFKERESLGAYDRQMEAVELAMMRIREVSG